MKKIRFGRRGAIALIVLVGFILRMWAALQLPIDADEPTYMQAAFDYAQLIKSGDLVGVINYPGNPEHPPLVKLFYAIAVRFLTRSSGWADALILGRSVSVIFGTLAVWVMALLDPVAGLLLALQNMAVKYTSEAYLEAIPLFGALAAVVALKFSTGNRDRYFWLSAAALGLTAAGKYSYFPILFVILYLFGIEKKYPWRDLLLYLAVALISFFILDPSLWNDPIHRLTSSILFHPQYSQSLHVIQENYPWFQPLRWISSSWPNLWHPSIFFFFSIDGLVFWLALAGIYFEWKEQRWVVVWLAIAMLALLLWPTKWPQYTLIIIPAVCLSASAVIRKAARWAREQEEYWGWFSTMIPNPPLVFGIALSGVTIFLIVFIAVNAIGISIDRRGWSHVLAELTPLPSNTVYAIAPEKDGRMVLGTGSGVAIWKAASPEQVQDQWKIYNHQNSGLPNDTVLSIKIEDQGTMWFGTLAGLASFDGQNWQTFGQRDFGLAGEQVHAIDIDSQGELWIGTDAGIASYNGQTWTSYPTEKTGLPGSLVLSLASQQHGGGEWIWAGTNQGLARLDPASGKATVVYLEASDQGVGGIPDLMVDTQGKLWVATLGDGLAVWDGSNWMHYRVSNSGLPTNTVNCVDEFEKGLIWICNSYPDRPGGLVTRYDGILWKTFRPFYSGYSGYQAISVGQDASMRYWFGTLVSGVDIYEAK